MKKVVRVYGNHSYVQGKRSQMSRKHWIMLALIAVAVGIIALATAPGFALMLLLLVVTAGLGYMKRYYQSAPVDMEVVSFGSAYLAAYHSAWLALFFALAGTTILEISSGGLRELSWIKYVSVMVTAIAAMIFANGSASIFVAVLLGLITQYLLMFVFTGDAVMNFVRRLTNAAFNAYIIFLLLPLFR